MAQNVGNNPCRLITGSSVVYEYKNSDTGTLLENKESLPNWAKQVSGKRTSVVHASSIHPKTLSAWLWSLSFASGSIAGVQTAEHTLPEAMMTTTWTTLEFAAQAYLTLKPRLFWQFVGCLILRHRYRETYPCADRSAFFPCLGYTGNVSLKLADVCFSKLTKRGVHNQSAYINTSGTNGLHVLWHCLSHLNHLSATPYF